MNRPEHIVIIGPVYPYKGGIAQYTGMMYRNLSKQHDVRMISFSRQYPKILFRKEQKDPSSDAFKVEPVEYMLDTADPGSWAKCAESIRSRHPDLVIFQWWHPYFAPCYQSIAKHLGTAKILFVCHNVFPHERFPMDRVLTRNTLQHGDMFIVHSAQDGEDLRTIRKDPLYREAVHPTYATFRQSGITRSAAREKLHLPADAELLLFFGLVRPYKGLGYLIDAMPRIREARPKVRLLIAGDFGKYGDQYRKQIADRGIEAVTDVHGGYLQDSEVEDVFSAADLVVLPYTSATQSGVVQTSFGFEKPVVVTKVGGLPEVVEDGRTGYVVQPENADAIADAVIRFFSEGRADEFMTAIRQGAGRFSWDRMTETIEELWGAVK